jgi:hypothetical protein
MASAPAGFRIGATISKVGFQTSRHESLVLAGADAKNLGVVMNVGPASDEVTVIAAPLADLTTAIATNIDSEFVEKQALCRL